jgi:hypothetical protein
VKLSPAGRPRIVSSLNRSDALFNFIKPETTVCEERLPLSAGWRNDQRMTDQAEQVSTTCLVDTKQQPGLTKRRRKRPVFPG